MMKWSFIILSGIRHTKYLVFPRVLQGTDERPVTAHGVATDGHPVRISGEVSVDQFRELREKDHQKD